MPRIDLRDGQWADLRDRITHAQDKLITKALARAKESTDEAVDLDTVVVRQFLRDWYVKDIDGGTIPADDPDAVERAPSDIVDALVTEASRLYTGATVPNEVPPPSSDAS